MPSRNRVSTDPRPFHHGGLKVRLLLLDFHPQLETIVYRVSEVLLAASRLHRRMPQPELNLLQFTTAVVTQLRAGSTIMPHAA